MFFWVRLAYKPPNKIQLLCSLKNTQLALLKFTADNIFTGTTMLGEGNVLVTDQAGIIQAIVPLAEAGDAVQYHPGILCPGFINSHCHLELSHMKGLIPEKTGLVDFVIAVMQKRGLAQDIILEAIANAEQEMLQNGIVAVGDICNTANTLAQKQQGNLAYYNFVEASGFVPAFAEARFKQAEEIFGQFTNSEWSMVNGQSASDYRQSAASFTMHESRFTTPHSPFTSIVPHAPYSTSLALMQRINQHSAGKVVTIHNQETKEENNFFVTGESGFRKLFALFNINIDFYQPSGSTSLQTYLPYLNKAASLLLVHNTFTSAEDVAFVQCEASIVNRETSNVNRETSNGNRETGIGNGESSIVDGENRASFTFHDSRCTFCLCPNANLYIENALPPVDMLRAHNARIVLGTDSLASNHALSILGEINTLRNHFSHIPTAELLQWATLNGAKALGMDSWLGSFDKGKQPGVLCINNNFSAVIRLV